MVMGIGFAAIRDIVAFLRYATHDEAGNASPLAPGEKPRIHHALGFGISQSGRVLRDLLYYGFNQDLAGRKVFDAMLPVVGGSRRTCVNSAFAQPGRYSRQHEDHSYGDDQFPFTYPTLTDPISGRTAGILQRARDAGVCPKVMHLDTESDAWQARSSLVVTDTGGGDIAMPDDVRVYLASGVQHAAPRPDGEAGHAVAGQPAWLWRVHAIAADCVGRVGGTWRSPARQPLSFARQQARWCRWPRREPDFPCCQV